jgi:hypothetical protein
MKNVSLALFWGLLGILVTGVTISSPVNGQTEIPTEKLVNALRTLNTAEYSYRRETGRFAHREEMLAFLRKEGDLSRSPIDFENPKPYELTITTSPDEVHYQISLKRKADPNDKNAVCRTAAFSDDSGLIYLGSVIGCESPNR